MDRPARRAQDPLRRPTPRLTTTSINQPPRPHTQKNGQSRPAREHGRPPPSAAGEHGVPHRVHPTVDRMQPAERDAVLDRPRRQTELGKLLTSDDPVLAPSTGRDRPIHRMWADLPTYVVANSAHAPRVAANALQRTPET